MPKYLIEVSQVLEALAERRIKQSVRTLGSHFATHAAWSRKDGARTGTLVVEADDRWIALGIVPPSLRSHARIFQLDSAAAA